MKKFALLALLLALVLVFVACGGNEATQSESASESVSESVTESATESESVTETQTESETESETEHVHVWTVTESVAPTCTEPGYIVQVCACGAEVTGDSDPLGHNLAGNILVNADGEKYIACVRCHEPIVLDESYLGELGERYDAVEDHPMEVIGWGDPNLADEEIRQKQYQLLLEAGINTELINQGMQWIPQLLEEYEEVGLRGLIYVHTVPSGNAIRPIFQLCSLFDNVAGAYLYDEPYSMDFSSIGSKADGLREYFPESVGGWHNCANLLGYGNSAYAWTGIYWNNRPSTPADVDPSLLQNPTYILFDENGDPILDGPYLQFIHGKEREAMDIAMQAYFDTVHPSDIWFDVYPLYNNADGLPNYVLSLLYFQEQARTHGIPMGTYIQTGDDAPEGPVFHPSYKQLRAEMNLSIAGGASTFLYYTAIGGMINYLGETHPGYDRVKQAQLGIHAMKGVHLDYCEDSYIILNAPEYLEPLEREQLSHLIVDSYDGLLSAETADRVFIGCSKNSEGKTGLYVVNLNLDYAETGALTQVTLHLDGEQEFLLWGDTEGLEAFGVTDTITLTLEAGEGCFIQLN